MSLKKRLIARLDIKGSKLIKGIRFEGVRVIGDPWEAALEYYSNGIDEIFYSDAVASLYGRNSLSELLTRTCKNVFVPITAGGGIRSVEDGQLLLKAGADKLAVNSCAVKNPELITSLASRFGEQCVVLSIQARRSIELASGWEVMIEAGRERTGLDLIDWIKIAQKLGVGEIFVTSVDQDGTQKGPDLDLLHRMNGEVKVPLIFGGGFNNNKEIKQVLKLDSISGISIGAALHYKEIEIQKLKSYLVTNDLPLRNYLPSSTISRSVIKKKVKVVVIDYGMGNQQSLKNSLEFIGCEVILSDDSKIIESSEIAILPGVGSFPSGMDELKSRGLVDIIINRFKTGKAILGICLGMQLLFEGSSEFKDTKGLGIFKGYITNLKDQEDSNKINNHTKLITETRVPHMGWNKLNRIVGKCKYNKTISK